VGRRLLALILLATAVYGAAPGSGTFIFTNSGRDPDEFRAFAKIASRLKRYGQVQIDIGVLAGKTTFEMSALEGCWSSASRRTGYAKPERASVVWRC